MQDFQFSSVSTSNNFANEFRYSVTFRPARPRYYRLRLVVLVALLVAFVVFVYEMLYSSNVGYWGLVKQILMYVILFAFSILLFIDGRKTYKSLRQRLKNAKASQQSSAITFPSQTSESTFSTQPQPNAREIKLLKKKFRSNLGQFVLGAFLFIGCLIMGSQQVYNTYLDLRDGPVTTVATYETSFHQFKYHGGYEAKITFRSDRGRLEFDLGNDREDLDRMILNPTLKVTYLPHTMTLLSYKPVTS